MSEYRSKTAHISADINTVFSKLSNPSTIGDVASKLPESQREVLKNIDFTEDSIVVKGSPMGDMALRRTSVVEPERIVFEAVQSPVPFKIVFELRKEESETLAEAIIDLDVPVFLRPMVKAPLEKACQQFGDLLEKIPYDKL